MMAIKITKHRNDAWYENEFGNVFGVVRVDSSGYCVKEEPGASYWIRKEDCEEV
jgi:hypothetical protein